MAEMLLTQLKAGQAATVKEILGGEGAIRKLGSLGIRPGKRIVKISSHFWRGPETIMVDNTKVAIGHGIAHKIMVEVHDAG